MLTSWKPKNDWSNKSTLHCTNKHPSMMFFLRRFSFHFSQVCTISNLPVWNLSLLTSALKSRFDETTVHIQCMYVFAVEGDHSIGYLFKSVGFGT